MWVDGLEKALYWFTSFFLEANVDSHCQLAAPLSDTTLLTSSNDLMSVIEIGGARRFVGPAEFDTMSAALSRALVKVMKGANGKQHSFSFGFRSSPESAVRLLKEILQPNLNTARRLGASDEIHLIDQVKALSAQCKEESIYLILYTHTAGLSPADRKRLNEWREAAAASMRKAAPGMGFRSDEFSQTPRVPSIALIPRHAAALNNLLQDLREDTDKNGVGILANVLDVGTGLSLMRRHLDATPFDSSWRPRLLGDRSAVLPGVAQRPGDASHLFPMRLGRQLVSEPLQEEFGDVEYAKRGNIYYAGVVLEVCPEVGSLPFSELTDRIGREIPWSLNLEMVPNGMSLRKIDQFYIGFMGSMGDQNGRVRDGWKHLKELDKAKYYIGAIRATLTTWATSESAVTDNLSFLRTSVESWGSTVVTNETGAPGLMALCAAAGFSKRMPAPYLPGPVAEFARMLPMFQAASVWNSGQLVTHTKGGRPYPVGLGTTKQDFWGVLNFAPSGRGKTFLMNMINLGILFAPGLEELPYLTVIDVGPGSRLVMDLARAILPEHLSRQITSIRIRNSRKYAVNPFDTQLGCDRPTAVDRDFQVSVVSTVCPVLGPEGERFIGQVIDEAYKMFGRNSPQQRRWQNSMSEGVAALLQKIEFEVTEKTFVYEVVDALFDRGLVDDASMAQRFAVPKLSDLIKASRATEILNAYDKTPTPTGELLIDVFTRNIQTAQTEYELISDFTQFEISNAKVVSIDLEEVVTGSDSEEGKRRAAMMFLFGRRLGAKNYFLRWDEIAPLVPDRYQAYQFDRIKRLEEAMKYLEYDEVHYATGMPAMAAQIAVDLRVGRKYKCVTVMSSQLLKDFPPAAVENCYTYFILGAGSETSLTGLRDTFGLSDSEVTAIKTECVSPGRLFGLFKTRDGATSQVLYSTAGAFIRWAFSTSKDDALLRTAVTELMGGRPADYLKALKMLAKQYPDGTAREAMDLYNRSRGEGSSGETVTNVFARKVMERASGIAA